MKVSFVKSPIDTNVVNIYLKKDNVNRPNRQIGTILKEGKSYLLNDFVNRAAFDAVTKLTEAKKVAERHFNDIFNIKNV